MAESRLHWDEMLRMAISGGSGRAGLAGWAAALGDVEFVLIREKALQAGELVSACREVRSVLTEATKVLVSGRVDIALAAGLDGVHLGGGTGELQVEQVRRLFQRAWVSVSCHSLGDVQQARAAGASGVLFAPVFGKTVDGVEVAQAAGLDVLRQVCEVAGEMPVFALGGVTEGNAADCILRGAAGVAGIRMFAGGA